MKALGFIFLLVCATGCSAYQPQTYDPEACPSCGSPLPEAVAELLRESDKMAAMGPSGPELRRSLAAADAVLAQLPEHEGAAWRAARALFLMSTHETGSKAAKLSARCMDVARLATDTGTAAESHYWSALCMGARARAKNLEGLDLLPTMVEAAQEALRINPNALHGGPDRVLGGIYLRAPAWPTSVGDIDAALEHLNAAVERAPDWPENYVLLAEAFLADGQEELAKVNLRKAEELNPSVKGWPTLWQADLQKLQKKLAD